MDAEEERGPVRVQLIPVTRTVKSLFPRDITKIDMKSKSKLCVCHDSNSARHKSAEQSGEKIIFSRYEVYRWPKQYLAKSKYHR